VIIIAIMGSTKVIEIIKLISVMKND